MALDISGSAVKGSDINPCLLDEVQICILKYESAASRQKVGPRQALDKSKDVQPRLTLAAHVCGNV